jgi:uncharacterized protein YcgI (DUF1989 family)
MRTVVPAREGRAVRVGSGESVRIVDVDGGQVGDLFFFVDGQVSEYMSLEHTRPGTGHLTPRPGDVLVTNLRRDIVRFDADMSPGIHDTLYAACDPARYKLLGADASHRSCATNLREAMAAVGEDSVHVPQPFNVFMHVAVGGDGELTIHPASSRPGDTLSFTALRDVVVALSSCPMDIIEINGGGLSDLAIEVG